jgi:hypothetical protein
VSFDDIARWYDEFKRFEAWYESDTRPFDPMDCSPYKAAWAAWQAALNCRRVVENQRQAVDSKDTS